MESKKARNYIYISLLCVFLFLCIVVSASVGSSSINPVESLKLVLNKIPLINRVIDTTDIKEIYEVIIWKVLRAKSHGAVLVLGSATPSIETRARAQKGVYHFLELTQRANPNAKIPQVEVVDFKDFVGRQEASDFTPPLLEKIRERLARKEQVVLMLNRRGYSSFVMCRDCGYVDDCRSEERRVGKECRL